MFAARALVAIAAAVVGIAIAQSPVPAADPPACVKPEAHPGHLASDTRKRQWVKDVNAWRECMAAHIADLQARAKSAIAVANKAVEDFNLTVKEFQEQSLAESGQ